LADFNPYEGIEGNFRQYDVPGDGNCFFYSIVVAESAMPLEHRAFFTDSFPPPKASEVTPTTRQTAALLRYWTSAFLTNFENKRDHIFADRRSKENMPISHDIESILLDLEQPSDKYTPGLLEQAKNKAYANFFLAAPLAYACRRNLHILSPSGTHNVRHGCTRYSTMVTLVFDPSYPTWNLWYNGVDHYNFCGPRNATHVPASPSNERADKALRATANWYKYTRNRIFNLDFP
jgi:hypothetical protein